MTGRVTAPEQTNVKIGPDRSTDRTVRCTVPLYVGPRLARGAWGRRWSGRRRAGAGAIAARIPFLTGGHVISESYRLTRPFSVFELSTQLSRTTVYERGRPSGPARGRPRRHTSPHDRHPLCCRRVDHTSLYLALPGCSPVAWWSGVRCVCSPPAESASPPEQICIWREHARQIVHQPV